MLDLDLIRLKPLGNTSVKKTVFKRRGFFIHEKKPFSFVNVVNDG